MVEDFLLMSRSDIEMKPRRRTADPDGAGGAGAPRRARSKAPDRDAGRQRTATATTDEKRERILAVAARLFFELGFANTTIERIAGELGVTKPFVYYYFRDKLALLEAMSWRPTELALRSMDFDAADPRPAHRKLEAGLERLIRTTIEHHPAATLPYRELQAYSARYRDAHRRLADRFYARMTALLEQARADGTVEFDDAKVTALAAASIAGFLYTWYRPDGRLSRDELVAQLTRVAVRAVGIRAGARARPAGPR